LAPRIFLFDGLVAKFKTLTQLNRQKDNCRITDCILLLALKSSAEKLNRVIAKTNYPFSPFKRINFILLPRTLRKHKGKTSIKFCLTIEVYLLAQTKACSPTCSAFKCAKNSMMFRRDSVWCRETEELCNVANCTYSMCMKRRMLPAGVCGETVKRQTVEKDFDDDAFDSSIRLKGKALRKLGDKEIF
jgi:hypothetical protein